MKDVKLVVVQVVQNKILFTEVKILNIIQKIKRNKLRKNSQHNYLKPGTAVVKIAWKLFQNQINHAFVKFLKKLERPNYLRLDARFVVVKVAIPKIGKAIMVIKEVAEYKRNNVDRDHEVNEKRIENKDVQDQTKRVRNVQNLDLHK